MASSSTDTLTLFATLPRYLQRRIDRAFDNFLPQTSDKPPNDLTSMLDTGDGFVIENQAPSGLGGGFIAEDADTTVDGEERSGIAMSSISAALQSLDLPPDDEQVLAIFRNAASGWSTSRSDVFCGRDTGGGMVSRDDWRAVCSVLFENHQEEDENDQDEPSRESDEDDASEDQYHASEGSDHDSDEDYVEDTGPLNSHRRTRGRPAKSSSPPHPSQKLTKRQQQVALETFALFFPSVPASEVVHQKIMLKDIQQIAKLLGEKIKADEVRHHQRAVSLIDAIPSVGR